jgi:signal transduction histidine kinase/CheY-like chemotaxis protein
MEFLIYGLIYLGSILMVYNIYGFARFARKTKEQEDFEKSGLILNIPVMLLILFLAGYLAVGIFGKPDLIISGILFGGSVFVFVMYILLDRITKRVLESERLKAELMVAEESNRAKNEFLSGISHEMRTPLNIIIGLNSLSLNDPVLSPETRERLEKTELSAKHMLSIINNILDMNCIETGEFIIKENAFSLKKATDQASAIAESLCSGKGIEYRYDFDSGIRVDRTGDDMRLKQILLNLLDNAVKYTSPPGTVTLSVREDGADRDRLIFTVKDTGTGIDEEFLPRIFDAFSKEDTSKISGYGGSGLGLAVTKNITELLGGSISVKSEKGVGSEFTVTLPMKAADPGRTEDREQVTLEGKRILIAEDIPENAEIAADLLELEGAGSEHAENGKIALEMFTSHDPGYYDAILMDLRMPVMDGITAAKEIRNSGKENAGSIPIIALTANAFESDVKESLGAGMNAHLSKPVDAKKLYATLKECIEESLKR